MKKKTLVKSAWPGRGIGVQCLVITKMRSLLNNVSINIIIELRKKLFLMLTMMIKKLSTLAFGNEKTHNKNEWS
jgi:hypothetical protein